MDPIAPSGKPVLPHSRLAFAVHVFTACGAGCALLALLAAVRSDWPQMFAWLGIALIIDGIDGTFARRMQVAEALPRWSGDVLDLVVDILTYVFVPAYAIAASGFLPRAASIPLGIIIVVTGALYFADRNMKTSDYYFRGFPALWNVAAFYLFVLKPEPLQAMVSIFMLAVFTFVPFPVVHPMRIPYLRVVTLVALFAWTLLAIFAVVKKLDPGHWTQLGLCLLAIYFIAAGLLRRSQS
jgi:phosphatidylcholine synthase